MKLKYSENYFMSKEKLKLINSNKQLVELSQEGMGDTHGEYIKKRSSIKWYECNSILE